MTALAPSTRIVVAEALYADGHPSTWTEFCRNNEDALSPAELDDIAASLQSGATFIGGGGAQGLWWVRIDPATSTKILTRHEPPPIPLRSFDWRAWVDGEEERGCGFGATEVEALADLLNNRLEERRAE